MKFNFPATRFACENSAEQQAEHALSEAAEVQELLEAPARDIDRIDEEMMDLLHSAETYWRIRAAGRGDAYVQMLRDRVVVKNEIRGYYP